MEKKSDLTKSTAIAGVLIIFSLVAALWFFCSWGTASRSVPPFFWIVMGLLSIVGVILALIATKAGERIAAIPFAIVGFALALANFWIFSLAREFFST